MRACLTFGVQYLVYVHNLETGSSESAALHGDAPVAPVPSEGLRSYARLWIDALEDDPMGAIDECLRGALEFEREHGDKIIHMTSTTSLELELGPGFDEVGSLIRSLQAVLAEQLPRLARSA